MAAAATQNYLGRKSKEANADVMKTGSLQLTVRAPFDGYAVFL